MTDTTFILHRTRRSVPLPEGRFEYRIWPLLQHPAASVLHRFWSLRDGERRTDIYLLHPGSDQTLVKLRDGQRLEIKRRKRDVGTVQHWTMPVSTGFPLTATRREELAMALSLPRGLPPSAGLSPAHLVAALDALDQPVATQTVQKSRLLFQSGICRAEICRVSIAGWRGTTVAVEAAELPSIAAAIDELRLGNLPNRSYGEALLRTAHPGLRSSHRFLTAMLTERTGP